MTISRFVKAAVKICQGGSSVLVLCDFRCGALSFMIILVIYKLKIGKNNC